jgi:hypothetical protein
MDCCDALKNHEDKDFLILKKYLESDGYFFDEHKGVYLGTCLMEKCNDEIEKALRKLGYDGGPLQTTARYHPDPGAVYSIFDSERLDETQVGKRIDGWIATKI